MSTLFGYIRVSTQDRELHLQLDALKNVGCKKDKIFIDKAVSGKSTDRPEYDKMMDYVKENNIDMIIVYTIY